MRREYGELVAFLRDEVGDGVRFVIAFDGTGYEFVYGEEWFERITDELDTRSRSEMHRDAVDTLERVTVASELYDNDIRSQIRVTDEGTGCYLFPDGEEGVFVWIDPETEVGIPSIVDACLDRIGGSD